MASVIAVKPSSGSTAITILAVLSVLSIGGYLAYRYLKGLSFPELKLPELKFPELPNIFNLPTIEDVPNLAVTPQGEGIGIEQTKQAFRVGFPTIRSSISRSFAPRGVIRTVGVRGKALAPTALARRQETFPGVLETPTGGKRAIAGSKALFDRLMENLRKSSIRKSTSAPTAEQRRAAQQQIFMLKNKRMFNPNLRKVSFGPRDREQIKRLSAIVNFGANIGGRRRFRR
jgi:ribosomal protein L28